LTYGRIYLFGIRKHSLFHGRDHRAFLDSEKRPKPGPGPARAKVTPAFGAGSTAPPAVRIPQITVHPTTAIPGARTTAEVSTAAAIIAGVLMAAAASVVADIIDSFQRQVRDSTKNPVVHRHSTRRSILLLPGCLALFAASLAANSFGQISNGFYTASDDASAPASTHEFGGPVRLGPQHKVEVLNASLLSEDNANTRFELSVNVDGGKDDVTNITILAVEGKTYTRRGWGRAAQKVWLMFPVMGAGNAADVAAYFGVPVHYRKNPGDDLSVTFTPSKSAFESGNIQIGEQVEVTLRIKNAGTNTIAFQVGGRNQARRDNQYSFSAEFNGKPVLDIGSSVNFGGLLQDKVLKPGEIFTNTVALNK
jgi:hypothetical protein